MTATAAASVRPWIARRAPEVALAAGAGTLALLAAAVGFALPESSPLSPDHAGGDSSWAWVYLAAMSGAFVFYVGGLAVLSRRGARLGAVVGARSRDPAAAARGPGTSVDGRLHVLGPGPGRHDPRSRSLHDAPERVSAGSGDSPHGRLLAGAPDGLRAGVHASLRGARARGGGPAGNRRVPLPRARSGVHARAHRAGRCARQGESVRRGLRRLEPAPRDPVRRRRSQRRTDDGARARSARARRTPADGAGRRLLGCVDRRQVGPARLLAAAGGRGVSPGPAR